MRSRKSLGSVVALSLLVLATVTSAGIINERSDVIFRNIQSKNTNPFEQPDLVGIYNGVLYAENNRDTPLVAENVTLGDFDCELSDLSNLGTLKVLAVNVSECVSRSGILDNTSDGVFRDVTLTTRDFIATENIYVGITGEHGICGSSLYTCSSGIFAKRTNSSTQYRWTCFGVGEGNDANCFKFRPPTCNSPLNSCGIGSFSDLLDIPTHHRWSCQNGEMSVTCQRIIPPACGSSRNSCNIPGSYRFLSSTSTHHRWRCVNGDLSVSCSEWILPSCGSSRSSCGVGTPCDSCVSDSSDYYQWECSNGGQSVTCSGRKPHWDCTYSQCSASDSSCDEGSQTIISCTCEGLGECTTTEPSGDRTCGGCSCSNCDC